MHTHIQSKQAVRQFAHTMIRSVPCPPAAVIDGRPTITNQDIIAQIRTQSDRFEFLRDC